MPKLILMIPGPNANKVTVCDWAADKRVPYKRFGHWGESAVKEFNELDLSLSISSFVGRTIELLLSLSAQKGCFTKAGEEKHLWI